MFKNKGITKKLKIIYAQYLPKHIPWGYSVSGKVRLLSTNYNINPQLWGIFGMGIRFNLSCNTSESELCCPTILLMRECKLKRRNKNPSKLLAIIGK